MSPRASQPSERTILVNPSAYDATAAPGPDVWTDCHASVCGRRFRGGGLLQLRRLLGQDLHDVVHTYIHTYIHVLSALRLRYHTGPSPWTVLGSVHATAPRTIHIPVDDRPMAARGAGSVGPCVPVRYTRAASTTDTPHTYTNASTLHWSPLPQLWGTRPGEAPGAVARARRRPRVQTSTHGRYRPLGTAPLLASVGIARAARSD